MEELRVDMRERTPEEQALYDRQVMKYDNITRAVFRKRPNRFIAEVDIDGRKETVHVKNTGRCKEGLRFYSLPATWSRANWR